MVKYLIEAQGCSADCTDIVGSCPLVCTCNSEAMFKPCCAYVYSGIYSTEDYTTVLKGGAHPPTHIF